MADGYLNKCKVCVSKYYKENKERYRRLNKEWRDSHRDKLIGYTNKHRDKYRNATLSRSKLGNSIRAGKVLRKKSCEECGEECVTHGHHFDYNKPLDVVWMCRTCHVNWHLINEPKNKKTGVFTDEII